jgi:branched-chain amino acid transport system permease protein
MVVLGGMGNIPGVMVGALVLYYVIFNVLPDAPHSVPQLMRSIGFDQLNQRSGDWPGLAEELQRIKLLVYGVILVMIMLLRPQGLLPSRVREQELARGGAQESVFDAQQA